MDGRYFFANFAPHKKRKMRRVRKVKLSENGFSKFRKNGKAIISDGPGNSRLAFFPSQKIYVLQKGVCPSGRCQQREIYRGSSKALVNKFLKEISEHYAKGCK